MFLGRGDTDRFRWDQRSCVWEGLRVSSVTYKGLQRLLPFQVPNCATWSPCLKFAPDLEYHPDSPDSPLVSLPTEQLPIFWGHCCSNSNRMYRCAEMVPTAALNVELTDRATPCGLVHVDCSEILQAPGGPLFLELELEGPRVIISARTICCVSMSLRVCGVEGWVDGMGGKSGRGGGSLWILFTCGRRSLWGYGWWIKNSRIHKNLGRIPTDMSFSLSKRPVWLKVFDLCFLGWCLFHVRHVLVSSGIPIWSVEDICAHRSGRMATPVFITLLPQCTPTPYTYFPHIWGGGQNLVWQNLWKKSTQCWATFPRVLANFPTNFVRWKFPLPLSRTQSGSPKALMTERLLHVTTAETLGRLTQAPRLSFLPIHTYPQNLDYIYTYFIGDLPYVSLCFFWVESKSVFRSDPSPRTRIIIILIYIHIIYIIYIISKYYIYIIYII